MARGSRLGHLVTLAGAPLEEIALAIAAELKPVDAPWARAELDRLAATVDRSTVDEPELRARALIAALAVGEGFDADSAEHPRSLMLDEVLGRRSGHPLALAIVYAAVAARIGVSLHAVGDRRSILLGDPEADPPLAIDPAPGADQRPQELRWLCPHLVALRMVDELGKRYMNRGDLANPIRLAELRLLLPLHPRLRRGHELGLRRLRSRLN